MKILFLILITTGFVFSKSLMAIKQHILYIDFHEVHNTATNTYETTMQLNGSLDLSGYGGDSISHSQPITASKVNPLAKQIRSYDQSCYIGSASFEMSGNWWKFYIPNNPSNQEVQTMGGTFQPTHGNGTGFMGFQLTAAALWIFDRNNDPNSPTAQPIFKFNPTVQNQTVSSVFDYSLSDMKIDIPSEPAALLFHPNLVSNGGSMTSQNYIKYRTFKTIIPEPRFTLFIYPVISIFLLPYRSVRRLSRI